MWSSALALVCVSGCAVYHPVVLPPGPDLTKTPSLTVPASEFWLPGLKPHPFPKSGLDETAVTTLAVFDNPSLKAARLQAGVAGAQLLEAGLLPDPVLNANFATSALDYGGGVGLTEDVRALITRGAAKARARANRQQVHLNILWQEWQVAERARELFIQSRADAQLQKVLSSTRDLLANRYREDRKALQGGDATLSTVTADLTLLTDADTKLRQLALSANLTDHQLNELLGLKPDVRLRLIGPDIAESLSQHQFRTALAIISHHRADLLALQAGYHAGEQNVREAILAQFPAVSIGVTLNRDPIEGVNDFGPNVRVSLPIFNRNRGQIAIQRATRAVLRETYEARLDQATSQADQVWGATTIMQRQLRSLNAHVSTLEKTAAAAKQGFQEGNISAALYVNMESSLLARQAEAIQLRASLASAQSALRTLLGLPFGAN